jgi:hypothetical protein
MLQVNLRGLSDNNRISIYIRRKDRLFSFDLAQQAPLLSNRAVKHLLEFPPGDVMQVVLTVQSPSIRADMLTVYPVRLAFTDAVLHCPRDEYMSVEILQSVVIVGITMMVG